MLDSRTGGFGYVLRNDISPAVVFNEDINVRCRMRHMISGMLSSESSSAPVLRAIVPVTRASWACKRAVAVKRSLIRFKGGRRQSSCCGPDACRRAGGGHTPATTQLREDAIHRGIMQRSEYTVSAYITASAAENKIHDDRVATRFGFRGGLVPGVDVFAYMTQPIVARWGRSWLERGSAAVRFLQPVYDGEEASIIADATDSALDIEVRNPAGALCATANAGLPAAVAPLPDLGNYPLKALPAHRPPASPESLTPGTVLGSLISGFHAERAPEYLEDVRESLPIYREQRIAHPGYLLRN